MTKPTLHLNLHKRWFDIIGDPKVEEYRQINEYWSRIFSNGKIKVRGRWYHPTDVQICFSNGYAKNRPQKTFDCVGLSVGSGNEEWGARRNEQYYIIKIKP